MAGGLEIPLAPAPKCGAFVRFLRFPHLTSRYFGTGSMFPGQIGRLRVVRKDIYGIYRGGERDSEDETSRNARKVASPSSTPHEMYVGRQVDAERSLASQVSLRLRGM